MKGRVERTKPSGSQMREDGLESAWVTVSSHARERFGGMPGAFGVGGKWISGRGTALWEGERAEGREGDADRGSWSLVRAELMDFGAGRRCGARTPLSRIPCPGSR